CHRRRPLLQMLLVVGLPDLLAPTDVGINLVLVMEVVRDRGVHLFQRQRWVLLALNLFGRHPLVEELDHVLDRYPVPLDADALRRPELGVELLEVEVVFQLHGVTIPTCYLRSSSSSPSILSGVTVIRASLLLRTAGPPS